MKIISIFAILVTFLVACAPIKKGSVSESKESSSTKQREVVRLVNNGNGTVSDADSKLIWHFKGSSNKMSWEQAKKYCESSMVGGYSDWMLPTLKQFTVLNKSLTKQKGKGKKRLSVLDWETNGHWSLDNKEKLAYLASFKEPTTTPVGAFAQFGPVGESGGSLIIGQGLQQGGGTVIAPGLWQIAWKKDGAFSARCVRQANK